MTLRDLPEIVQLELATLTLPEWHPEAGASGGCVVYGYAIDHPDGVIVFDTGVGAGNQLIDELYQPELVPLDQALAGAGLAIEAVSAVVNSHLHFDHCGQNPLLYGSDVPFYVGRSELATVEVEPTYTIAEWALPPDDQRRSVDEDRTIAEGVTILATPGHTAGHVAVVVEGPAERIVLAGQVVWNVAEFVDEVATESNVATDDLRAAAVDSIRRIKALDPSRVYFAHCEHCERSDLRTDGSA